MPLLESKSGQVPPLNWLGSVGKFLSCLCRGHFYSLLSKGPDSALAPKHLPGGHSQPSTHFLMLPSVYSLR